MGWVKRKADEHVCKKPHWDKTVSEGDVWQCDGCKVKWRVRKVKTWYDQREAPYEYGSLEWEYYRGYYYERSTGVTSWRDQ